MAVGGPVAAQEVQEALGDGAEFVALAADDAEGPDKPAALERPRRQHPRLHFAPHRRLGQKRDAQPVGHGLFDRLRVVERRLLAHADTVVAQEALRLVADDQAPLEMDIAGAVEVRGADRR